MSDVARPRRTVGYGSMRLTSACCALLLVAAACHRAADLTEQARTTTRPELSLRRANATGDTTRVVLHLEPGIGGAPQVLGSFTGDVGRNTGWRFVGCSAPQGHPLLACNDAGAMVRIAAAWVEGVTTGDLLTLTFVANAAPTSSVPTSVASDDAAWQLGVQEVHAIGGASLTDALDVRRDVRREIRQ
jgi:hypothetical protein